MWTLLAIALADTGAPEVVERRTWTTGPRFHGRIELIDANPLLPSSRTEVEHYAAVPYAHAPVGDRRFRQSALRLLSDLPGDVDATEPGPACRHQLLPAQLTADNWYGDNEYTASVQSEDCLALQIWTPEGATPSSDHPVLVWFHGGGFNRGTSIDPRVAGRVLAGLGIVVVIPNYRLGALGFLHNDALEYDPTDTIQGNFGLSDQLTALEWIARFVHYFGGDADQITIAGTSAGGASVQHLMTSPLVRDRWGQGDPLFHRAIVGSGGGVGPKLPLSGAGRTAHSISQPLFDAIADGTVACASGPATPSEVLRNCVDYTTLVDVFGVQTSSGCGSDDWRCEGSITRGEVRDYPFVDGILVDRTRVADAFADGESLPIPLLVGATTGEDSVIGPLGGTAATTARRYFPAGTDDLTIAQEVLDLYGSTAVLQANDPLASLALQPYLARFYGDATFRGPAALLAAYHRHHHALPTYLYEFAYATVQRRTYLYGLGLPADELEAQMAHATHSAERFSLFGTAERRTTVPPVVSAADHDFNAAVQLRWGGFILHGDPDTFLSEAGGDPWPIASTAPVHGVDGLYVGTDPSGWYDPEAFTLEASPGLRADVLPFLANAWGLPIHLNPASTPPPSRSARVRALVERILRYFQPRPTP